jgi:uncharacterized membrane-anchored protein
MEPFKRWCLWLAATTAATVTLWLLPVAAWAQSGPAVALVGDELARPRRRGGSGLLGACCCLVVVLVIVLVVMLLRRRRQAPPPPPPA